MFAARNDTNSNRTDADKITRAQLNVASWYLEGGVDCHFPPQLCRASGWSNELAESVRLKSKQ